MTFPQPDYDAATLDLMAARRDEFQTVCPRHPDRQARLAYWKELYVGTEGDMHTVASAIYADGCMARVVVDTDEEPTWTEVGPPTV